jgi:hypothetical protein
MSFIAGYVGRKGRYESSSLEQRAKSYRILADDDLDDYRTLMFETKTGHLIQKCKARYPVQTPPACDNEGNILLTLGFTRSAPASVLLESSIRNCAASLEEAEGEFVFILAEGRSGRVHIVNDRFGARPFYILADDRGTYFSSNLTFLLYLADGKHEPDALGWFQLFKCHHTVGTRTTLKNVRRLRPATHLTITFDGRLQERQYWRLCHRPEQDLDPVVHSHRIFEAFKAGATFRAKLVSKGVLALSGGLDSRLVASVLPADTDFSAFTFVNSTSTAETSETQAAAETCAALGLEHNIQPIVGQPFSEIAKDVINLTGGLRPLQHMALVMPYVRELKRVGSSFLLGGGPGDLIAGSRITLLSHLDPRRVNQNVRRFCHELAFDHNLRVLFRDDVVRQCQRDLYRSLLESFDELGGRTSAHKITAWALVHRWPAFTFTSVLHTHPDVTEAFCHLDYRFCDLMLTLPAEWLYDRQFYAFMIYECLPHLRHVIYANTGKVLDGRLSAVTVQESPRKSVRSLLSITMRQALPSWLIERIRPSRRGSPSFHHALFRSDTKLLKDMEETLHGAGPLRALVDADRCLRFLERFRNDDLGELSYDEQADLIGGLATMCLSFRHLHM